MKKSDNNPTKSLEPGWQEVAVGRMLSLATRIPGLISMFCRLQNRCTAGFLGHGGYAPRRWPELVTAFGRENGGKPVIAYIDGSYLLREGGRRMVTFGVKNIPGKIDWSLRDGWLPCPRSSYEKRGVRYTIKSFCGADAPPVVYSRLTVENKSGVPIKSPKVSRHLTLLSNTAPKVILPGESVVLEYAVPAAKPALPKEQLWINGNWEAQYARMKTYWEKRLEPLLTIEALPAPELIDATKAGYVFTMILRKDGELRTGANGYERVFDHDGIGILAGLLTLGDTQNFRAYAGQILKNLQYPDARWKLPWVYALYYLKTGDLRPIREAWEELSARHLQLLGEMEPSGVMRQTCAIDSYGHWLCDNWSALLGLGAYAFLAERLGREAAAAVAKEQYFRLAKGLSQALERTMGRYKLAYLPINIDEPNEIGARKDPRDANWASMFLFGRWAWDGWLLNLPQGGAMIETIDATYTHGFQRRERVGGRSAATLNFGGYPHGWYSSAYNAGYGAAALRGELYRGLGIESYLFMLQYSQSGPFSWWEAIRPPKAKSPWSNPHASGGSGSCPHMWGQANATKVLIESLCAQRADGTVVIGRGVPTEWVAEGHAIALKHIPTLGKRFAFRMETAGSRVTLRLTGLPEEARVSWELPSFRIRKVLAVAGGAWDEAAGRVLLEAGASEVYVELL